MNKHLRAALADAGVTEQDYAQIQRARRIVDKVNAGLAARGASLLFSVGMHPVGPVNGHAHWAKADRS